MIWLVQPIKIILWRLTAYNTTSYGEEDDDEEEEEEEDQNSLHRTSRFLPSNGQDHAQYSLPEGQAE